MNVIKRYIVAMILLFGRFMPNRANGHWIAGASSGVGLAGLGATQLLSILGFSVVPHSSGAALLSGAGGYIDGTYGLSAVLAIFIFPFSALIFLTMVGFGLVVRFKKGTDKHEAGVHPDSAPWSA